MLSLHILTSTVEFHGKREGAPPTRAVSRRRSNVRSFFPLPQLISSEAGLAKSEATASDGRIYPKPGGGGRVSCFGSAMKKWVKKASILVEQGFSSFFGIFDDFLE